MSSNVNLEILPKVDGTGAKMWTFAAVGGRPLQQLPRPPRLQPWSGWLRPALSQARAGADLCRPLPLASRCRFRFLNPFDIMSRPESIAAGKRECGALRGAGDLCSGLLSFLRLSHGLNCCLLRFRERLETFLHLNEIDEINMR